MALTISRTGWTRGPAPGFGRGQQQRERGPLGISDISRIQLSVVHSPYNVATVGTADHFSDSFLLIRTLNAKVRAVP
jgi:hypothetical protein